MKKETLCTLNSKIILNTTPFTNTNFKAKKTLSNDVKMNSVYFKSKTSDAIWKKILPAVSQSLSLPVISIDFYFSEDFILDL